MSEELIRRSDAIDAIENTDWYHQNRNKDMVSGANSDEHQAWYKADDVYKALEAITTIEPKRGRWKIEGAETIYGKAYLLTCSECGETVSVTETALPYEHFCRNCGADMRGAE